MKRYFRDVTFFIKKSVVLDDKNVIFLRNVISFEKMSCFSKKCHIARHQKVCYVILAKEGKQKGQQVGQKNPSIARVND